MRYRSGQQLSANVLAALRFAGKTGFLSRDAWHEFFGKGDLRWSRRQLQRLEERGLLKPHPNPAAKGYFVPTLYTQQLLENENSVHIGPAPVAQIHHDETVARSLLVLEREGMLAAWCMEGELKSQQVKDFQISRDVRNKKYPDAVVTARVFGKERTFAIEYERTRKAVTRYKDILWLYSRSDSFAMILFVVENQTIQKLIEGRMNFLRITNLYDRVAFVLADDWRKRPADAPIQLGTKVITLRGICQMRRSDPSEKLAPAQTL